MCGSESEASSCQTVHQPDRQNTLNYPDTPSVELFNKKQTE